MRIIQLPEAQAIYASDVFAININGADYQVPVSLLVTAIQALGNYLTAGDVANNLTTTVAGKVLDARQGPALTELIAQSSAITNVKSLLTVAGNWCEVRYAYRTGNVVYIQLWVAAGTTSGKTLVTISDAIRPVVADYCVPCLYEQAGTVANSTAWIEHVDVSKVTYYGDTSTAVTRVNLMYFTE